MCGICGVVAKMSAATAPDETAVSEQLHRAMKELAPRGPDDSGTSLGPGWGFGHTRLAVIDPASGHQPMMSADEQIALTYNGEIYNFAELRESLYSKGYTFQTNCDTEVVLQAYREWGTACVQYFNGMFAFAVRDAANRQTFLARDRVGVKPLFYSIGSETLCFASSLTALLRCREKGFEPDLDLPAVSHYLTTSRCTLGHRTLIRDFWTLEPGTYCIYDEAEGTLQTVRYWRFPVIPPDDKTDVSFAEATRDARELIENAVSQRLVSDVPVGAFLSGGLDSSVVTSAASAERGESLPLFCAGTEDTSLNEFSHAQKMASILNAPLHNETIRSEEFASLWPSLTRFKGMPLSTPNEVSIYRLACALRESCTVTLTGEGADELFGGYTQPQFGAFDFERAARSPEDVQMDDPLSYAFVMRFGRGFFFNDVDHFFLTNSWVPMYRKAELFKPEIWDALEEDDAVFSFYEDFFDSLEGCSSFDKRMHLFAAFNLENLLARIDSSTMYASVEARVPFTDHRVAEFLFQTPDSFKMTCRNKKAAEEGARLPVDQIDERGLLVTKRLLRDAFQQEIPEEIRQRRKMSFPVPFTDWLTTDLVQEAERLCLQTELPQRLFQEGYVANMLDMKDRNLWLIANLAQWWEQIKRVLKD